MTTEESKFESLLSEARILFEKGQFRSSLELCNQAYAIKPCPKLLRKIERIKPYVDSANKEDDSDVENSPPTPVREVARHLIDRAREAFKSGNLSDALRFLKESYECVPCDKTAGKISKVEEAIRMTELEQAAAGDARPSSSKKEHNEADAESMLTKARVLYEEGQLERCIRLLREIQLIAPSDKIQRKIDRIGAQLSETNGYNQMGSRADDVVNVAEGLRLPRALYEKLYEYQKDGVKWLWDLHTRAPGGILADDMGLGKTVQVIAFLSGLFISSSKRLTALILMPVSVLVTWEAELKRWAPALRVVVFHDGNRSQRLRSLSMIQRNGGIVLTTYGMVAAGAEDLIVDFHANPQFMSAKLSNLEGRMAPEFVWDYLILDEAHKIKNPSAKTTKAVLSIAAEHRVLLTGTAVQNNLLELWSLYNCTHSGRLLGRMQTFKNEYEKPIKRAREKDASRAERAHGQLMAQSLRRIIDPYFLRRTKEEILPSGVDKKASVSPADPDIGLVTPVEPMPKKTELVLWIYLREVQERSYRDFLELDQVKELLIGTTRRSPLMELLILKKLCDHPRLLSPHQCASLNLEVTSVPDERYSKHSLPPASQLVQESGKLMFLSLLMSSFLREKQPGSGTVPKTLIFSQSIRFLDMAEKVILSINNRPETTSQFRGHRVLRLDGRLTKVEERLDVIRLFERDPSYTVMLLTTQVGGVGLTLTAASRVIILDPSWNPATDAQAVDRAYRIGQKSDVIVYRLLTCGTVEEKIYRRQIFKNSVIRQTTTTGQNKADQDPYRYFTNQDLRELFSLGDPRISTTQQQLAALHKEAEKWSDETIRPHLLYLTGQDHKDTVFGLSFHDLLFSRKEAVQCEETTPGEHEFLHNRLKAAEHAIARECVDVKDPSEQVVSTKVPTKSRPAYVAPVQLPADGVFLIPSKVDSKRPMLNRPQLGNRYPSSDIVKPPHVPDSVNLDDAGTSQEVPVIVIEDELTESLMEMSISGPPKNPREDVNCAPLVTRKAGSAGSPVSMTRTSSGVPHLVTGSEGAINRQMTPPNSLDQASRSVEKWATSPTESNPSIRYTNDHSSSVKSHGADLNSSLGSHKPLNVNPPPTITCNSLANSSSSPLPLQKSFSNSALINAFQSTPIVSEKQQPPTTLLTPLARPTKFGRLHSPIIVTMPPANAVCKTAQSPEALLDLGGMDVIHMDITLDVDEDELMRTVDMGSVHRILAKSGLTAGSTDDDVRDVQCPELLIIEDSRVYTSPGRSDPGDASHVNETADDLEIIEDSVGE
ncbi:DNA excision repair protein ERCC-6-like [Clonorchis sinensis]|uniref:DNA excision repair protein ERCC-6-like n=1 Tax=Clonorchis sinensis TaxID=79923 RepID=A0A8T1MNV6_CLOSI|nr:DNA excision repair protein ERCC-6-like [Clonorchis sinensis]